MFLRFLRLLPVLALAACGGKVILYGGEPENEVCAADGGASSFAGTWSCTTSGSGPPPPAGQTASYAGGTSPYEITDNTDGTITIVAGPVGVESTCGPLRFAVQGSVATLDGTQTCIEGTLEVVSGTFTIDGCRATISNFTGWEVKPPSLGGVQHPDTVTGSCTKSH